MEDLSSYLGRFDRLDRHDPDHINALRSSPILPLPLVLEAFQIQDRTSSLCQESKRRPCGSLTDSKNRPGPS